MTGYAPVSPQTCCKCQQQFSAEEVSADPGWTPLRSGWRCPTCSRERWARINKLAIALRTTHRRHDWAGRPEHRAYDECVFCEVLAVATELALGAEGIPGAPARPARDRRRPAAVPRSCCKCGRFFNEKERHSESSAWMPLRSGWRCTECTHERHAMIHRIAATLIAEHRERRWLGLAEHASWDECVFCDVLATATGISLAAPSAHITEAVEG